MVIKYNTDIHNEDIIKQINKLTNRIYKLLPLREEGSDWETPLQSLILELTGMASLLSDHVDMFSILCKLEALKGLKKDDDFILFRKTIFECLSLMNQVKEKCQD